MPVKRGKIFAPGNFLVNECPTGAAKRAGDAGIECEAYWRVERSFLMFVLDA
jgi:hypothetical protein